MKHIELHFVTGCNTNQADYHPNPCRLSSPCDVRHGAERIVALCDGDSGHLVHGQHIALPVGQFPHQLRVLRWIDEAHQGGVGLQQVRLAQSGGSNLQQKEECYRAGHTPNCLISRGHNGCVRTLRTRSEPRAPLTSVMVAPASL